MKTSDKLYMGIDIGSVSLNIAIIDEQVRLFASVYERTKGQPVPVLLDAFNNLAGDFPKISGVLATGSGRDLVSDILGVDKENEIVTQSRAVSYFHPEVRTVIEMGGQDSKLIFLEPDERKKRSIIVDHALNEICAAGTGSFLDQQAYRLGISIEKEFGDLSLKSRKPATIAGRCSVFAKSDMVHLQQEGAQREDIVAGLCYALARNYISNLGKGRKFKKPIAFQGGVAANKGVVRAFEDLLGLEPGELIIPEHFLIMGALGSAIMAREKGRGTPLELNKGIDSLRQYLIKTASESKHTFLKKLVWSGDDINPVLEDIDIQKGRREKVYLGIDVGAASTNIVILDKNKILLRKIYLMTEGEPVESVKKGLLDIAKGIEDLVDVQAVGVTGSGRYFVGDFVGADVVINEITAQSKATLEIDNSVDTIFEIGGQDSKYIRLKTGSVVDFEMNKVCAAGTGSFLQEQAARLGIKIEEFSGLAFNSKSPADLGTRCTVFMESDLIHHQQVGLPKVDLVAGLAYSVANNYIEKVIGNKKIGNKIYFQGGVASNKSVAAAFENILGKQVTVPEQHNVTGAIGAALIARERRDGSKGKSNFVGFDLRQRTYEVKTFECQHCPNHCDVKRVLIGGKQESFFGGICDRYELKRGDTERKNVPDLFKEWEDIFFSYYTEDEFTHSSPAIGIPRILMFFEQFPLWAAFFKELGIKVVLSDKTNSRLIHRGLQEILAETCYPVKVAYGHMVNLIEKGVDYIFLPCVIDLEKDREDVNRSYNCPYIQAIPFILKAAFETKIKIKSPTIFMAKEKRNLERQMAEVGRELGKPKKDVDSAISIALKSQEEFEKRRLKRGQEVLASLREDEQAIIVIGKPYNVHDTGLNLNISKKLRKLGVTAIPYDMLPLDTVELPSHYSNLVWKNEQNLLRSALLSKTSKNLHPIMITNYGCGPDAFFAKYLEDTMGDDPALVLEVDEHSGDAGMVTRIEAFLDTLGRPKDKESVEVQEDLSVVGSRGVISVFKPSKRIKELEKTLYIYNASGHSNVWAAAFQSVGVDARVLPMPDEQSEELGRKYASARECHPYLVTTGDLVKRVQCADFDPDRAAFVTLNFDGSCRMSQYGLSQKLVLKRLGLSHVPVIAPITSIRHDDASRMFGVNWAKAIWKGWLATDVLLKKLLHTRPYEVNEGQSDRVYEKAIEDISSGIVNDTFDKALKKSIIAMDAIPVKKERKPIIGIVGEFYSCMNAWANNDLIKQLESLGAEVRYGPSTTDYLVYFNEAYPRIHLSRGEYPAALYYYIRRYWFMRWKEKIEGMLGSDLYEDCSVPKMAERIETASPYATDSIDPVVTVNLSKAKKYAERGCSGIANLIVLNCLYGTLATAIYKKIQREHNNIPMITMIYEGLKPTNEKTRIEAFMHQAKSYNERYYNQD